MKVTASGYSDAEAVARMRRALSEFKVRGVETNLTFLYGLVSHPNFLKGDYNTGFIDDKPELLELPDDTSSGSLLTEFIADLRTPSSRFRPRAMQPLAERNPLLFWKGLALFQALLIATLLVSWLKG